MEAGNIRDMVDDIKHCRKWIEDALEHCDGTHKFDDVAESISKGSMQLWSSPKGCIVTEIVVYPRKTVLHVFLGGGELEQILDMDKDVKEWATKQGCTASTMSGRSGWKKPLAGLGWKPTQTSYIKEFY